MTKFSLNRVIQYIACAYEASGFIDMCKECTSYKIEYCQEDGTTALGAAVKNSNYEIVKVILNQKNAPSLINAADAQGKTPLMYAIYECLGGIGFKVLELILDKFEEFVEKKKCTDIAMLAGLSIWNKDSVFFQLPTEIILSEILPKIPVINSVINSPFLSGPSKELDINTYAFNKIGNCYTSLSEFKKVSNQYNILDHDIRVNDLLLERIENLANTKF